MNRRGVTAGAGPVGEALLLPGATACGKVEEGEGENERLLNTAVLF